MDRTVVLMPGLFRVTTTREREDRPRLELRRQFMDGEVSALYEGVALSADDLRALQGIVALASHEYRAPPGTGKRGIKAPTPVVEVHTSLRRLAQVVGHDSAGAGRTNSIFEACVQRLATGQLIWRENIGSLELKEPLLTVLTHTPPPPRAMRDAPRKPRRHGVHVRLHPRLAQAVAAGRKGTHHLKLDMEEVRQLKSPTTRILHHRLIHADPGERLAYAEGTLLSYVAPVEELSRHQLRHLTPRLTAALGELASSLGWLVKKDDEKTVGGQTKWWITRPRAA